MFTKIRYLGYQPSANEERDSEMKITQVATRAPINSSIIALIESDGFEYCCTIDVFTERNSVYTSYVETSAASAVERAVGRIEEKLLQLH